MDEKAKDIMIEINLKLGNILCSALDEGELRVLSAGAAMIFDDDKVHVLSFLQYCNYECTCGQTS